MAALAALALGGAAIAGATGGGSSDQPTAESEQGNEASEAADAPGDDQNEVGEADEGADEAGAAEEGGDGDGELPAAAEQKARAAAERATGGQATGDIEPAEQADPVEDPNDEPTPKGAAYEVEVAKDGQALKVFLDSSFGVVETQHDAG